MLTLIVLTMVSLVGLAVEAVVVRTHVRAIKIRVHIGGTRGKSGVTIAIAAALRHAGYRVLGKVTGGRPTILTPDGTRQVIARRGPARVQEQVRMVYRARRMRCDALVLECMSVAPALQRLESRLLQPTVSILTNVRDDHKEEFGPDGYLDGLSSFLPHNGFLVSGEVAFAEEISRRALEQGTRVIRPTAEDVAAASELPAETHRENAALVLAVCRELGIPKAAALAGIHECALEMGKALISMVTHAGTIRFLNGFAVNDVTSAARFLETWRERLGGWTAMTVVLNTRIDRPYRSVQFAHWCAALPGLQGVILTGGHAPFARRALEIAGMDAGKVSVWSRRQILNPVPSLAALYPGEGAIVVGLGNIAGDGYRILEGLRTWS